MADSFILGVASDFTAGLINNMMQAVGGPSVEKIQELISQKRLMVRVVSQLCTGYDKLGSAEGAENGLLVIDERFFQDPAVRETFTERLVTGDVDQARLRNRFIELYGDEQIALFDRNLKDALSIFERELRAMLSPAERAAFASLDQNLKDSTQEILAAQSRTAHLITETRQQVVESVSSMAREMRVDVELASEFRAQLDHARDLLHKFQPKTALEYLGGLKDRIWDRALPVDRFRLLTYGGFAHLQLNEELETAQMFIDALTFNNESASALCNAALGFLLRGDTERCQALAFRALERDPTCEQAYSMLVYASEEKPFESLVDEVPEVYRRSVEVAMALGKVAFKRDMLANAERWFRVAVDVDTRDHPEPCGMLADSILTQLVGDSSIHPMPGLINPKAELASEAVELYDTAWGRVAESEIRSLKISWLVNRATAKVFQNDVDGAIQDLEEALREAPGDRGIIKNRAMLAYGTRDLLRASALLRQILDSEGVPDARLWLSMVLFEDGRLDEAEMTLDKLLEGLDNSSGVWRDANYVYTLIKLKQADLPGARTAARSLKATSPEDPGILALCSRVARREGHSEEADSLLLEAQSKVTPETGPVARYRLLDELYDIGKYEAAGSILEEIVDASIDSGPTRQLLSCYYLSGNLGPALKICRSLRETYGPLRFVSAMESAIHEEIGNLSAAMQVCHEYLGLYPDDQWVKLRLAVVSQRLKDYETLDGILNQDFDISNLPFENHAQLARLYLHRGRDREALEIAYEARRRFFDNPKAHLVYVQIFFRRNDREDSRFDVDQVESETAVQIEHLESDRLKWVIIEDRDDVDMGRGELGLSHPHVQSLLGSKVGDSVNLPYGVSTEQVTVREIKSKYVYALHETMDAYQWRFPDTPGIWRGRIQVDAADEAVDGLRPVLDMLDHRYEGIHEAERFYREGKLPIGCMAEALGKNPIEIQATLTAKPDLGIRCCSVRSDEREAAVALVDSGADLVIDIVSLMTLHQLGVSDSVVQEYGPFAVVRSTLELIEELLFEQSIHGGEYWTLGKKGDQYVRTLVTQELIEDRRRFLKNVLSWAESNCRVLPCTAALNIKRDVRRKLGDMIGPSFVETILVATDDKRVLYSDDAPLRELAATEYGVQGVWTQPVLISLHQRGQLSSDAYAEAIVKLVTLNHRHTSISAQVLLEATRQAEWRPAFPFLQVVQTLEGGNSNRRSAVKVAVEYVHLLCKQKPLDIQFDWLVTAVLDAITAGRDRRAVLEAFLRGIEIKFATAPIQIDRIHRLLRAWTTIHPL